MTFDIEKYKNKKILIVGGGTSTLDSTWENLDYDYLWTCNDFFLEERVLKQEIDLFLLAWTTDIGNEVLINKLKDSDTKVFYEGIHYRGKQNTNEFKKFKEAINIPIYSMEFFQVSKSESPAAFSGATFRMIATALHTEASQIYFVGFDGWNKNFSNVHAFTKQRGLKDSDTRRTFSGTRDSYETVFKESYRYFTKFPNYRRLQNIGEGYDYNLGTNVSKNYFPLNEETLALLGKSTR